MVFVSLFSISCTHTYTLSFLLAASCYHYYSENFLFHSCIFFEIFIVEEWQVIEYGLSRTFLRGVYVCSIYLIEFQIFRGGDDDDKKLLVHS